MAHGAPTPMKGVHGDPLMRAPLASGWKRLSRPPRWPVGPGRRSMIASASANSAAPASTAFPHPGARAQRLARWHRPAMFVVGLTNAILLVSLATWPRQGAPDWELWTKLPAALARHDLYTPIVISHGPPNSYVYSPIAALILGPLASLGAVPFAGLHLLALLALPRRVALLAALSFPFWVDTLFGNMFTFVFVPPISR